MSSIFSRSEKEKLLERMSGEMGIPSAFLSYKEESFGDGPSQKSLTVGLLYKATGRWLWAVQFHIWGGKLMPASVLGTVDAGLLLAKLGEEKE